MNLQNLPKPPPELTAAVKAVKQHFVYAAWFSAAINLLHLAPILFMMQLYDRVLASGSLPTLFNLTLLLVLLLGAMAAFEWVRSYLLIYASNKIEASLRERVFNSAFQLALMGPQGKYHMQAMSDLTGLRQFLCGNGVFALFDLPWFVLFLLIMWLIHPNFFWFSLVAVVIMGTMAYITEKITGKRLKDANEQMNKGMGHMVNSLRNAEIIAALGMTGSVRNRQMGLSDEVLRLQTEASKLAGMMSSMSRAIRMLLQSLILALGAWMTIGGNFTGGKMIAGSLLLSRTLAPIDLLISIWKNIAVARDQYERLCKLLDQVPAEPERMPLPAPLGNLALEQAYITPPGANAPVLRGISFQLDAGDVLGVIGPSASGKSTLARAILGLWPAFSGKVRLDGADILKWRRSDLGPYLGYLPQDIELFDGTIADNICRFNEPDAEKIVTAARLAGVHEMILRQPEGYDTMISGSGGVLSGGQRQRIGLARAIYGAPKLLVLDEPNSNLDDQGERELVAAIHRIKALGCTIIIISHRTMVLAAVDKVLVLKDGVSIGFGQRDQVLAQLKQSAAQPTALAS